jgi:hypothetical protein
MKERKEKKKKTRTIVRIYLETRCKLFFLKFLNLFLFKIKKFMVSNRFDVLISK